MTVDLRFVSPTVVSSRFCRAPISSPGVLWALMVSGLSQRRVVTWLCGGPVQTSGSGSGVRPVPIHLRLQQRCTCTCNSPDSEDWPHRAKPVPAERSYVVPAQYGLEAVSGTG